MPAEVDTTVLHEIRKVQTTGNLDDLLIVNFQGRVLDQLKKFTEHFVTVGLKLASSIGQNTIDKLAKYLKWINENVPKFQFTQFDANYIKKAVMLLKSSKSSGNNKIPIELLKDAIEAICQHLAIVFNTSFKGETFPDIWKLARVTQLFKSSQKSNLSNYKPISVLSVFPRLLEKLAHNQLYDFARANDLVSKNQFACGKLKSKIISMLNITEA